MLNNITNFFNLIKTGKVKTQLDSTELLPIGTKDLRFSGQYQPTMIKYGDFISGLVGDLKGMAGVAPANLMGQSYRKIKLFSERPEKLLSKVNQVFPPDSKIHKMVEDIAANPDLNKRRAGINSLMQISAFRNIMKDEEDGEESR